MKWTTSKLKAHLIFQKSTIESESAPSEGRTDCNCTPIHQRSHMDCIGCVVILFCNALALAQQMDARNVMHEMFDNPSPPPLSFSSSRLMSPAAPVVGLRGSLSTPTSTPSIAPPTTNASPVFNGPPRFAQETVATKAKGIGPCSCDFLSGVDATNPVGSTASCAP